MRGKLLISSAVLLLGVAAASLVATGGAEDNNDQRISDLETRVAALEAEVFGSTPAAESTSDDRNDSSSNSSNSYSGSYSGSGDREIEIEIDNAGTYHLTVTSSSALELVFENDAGEPIEAFAITIDEAGTATGSAPLEPGNYVLRVTSSSNWNATLVSVG